MRDIVQVVVSVAPGVGMGKLVAQIGCNLRIVGVAQQRVEVVLAPGTNAEIAKVEQHDWSQIQSCRMRVEDGRAS